MNLPERVYRRLLIAYPREFRSRYGPAMEEFFSFRLEQARRRGVAARGWFLIDIASDLFRSALAERLSSIPRPGRAKHRKEHHVDTAFQDIKHALRRLIDAPAFTLSALVIIGLGIGVNVAMFSIVESVLFRPPPWGNVEELVWVYQDSDDGEPNSCSFPAFRDIASQDDVFASVAALIPGRSARYLDPSGNAREVTVTYATSSLFPVLDLEPSRGRWLNSDADVPGGEPTGVLSYHTWVTRFGSDPSIVGESVRLNGVAVAIVGIGPKDYRGEASGLDNDFWLSIAAAGRVGGEWYFRTLERREDHWFQVIARRQEKVATAEAQAAMNVLATRLATNFPDLNEGREITVLPATGVRVHPEYDAMLFPVGAVLMGIVGLVLLIACANLANLLLARGSARSREIAVRLAIGATRWRIVRQLLTESVVLAIGGGVMGIGLAAVAGRVLAATQLPLPVPLNLAVVLDARILTFAFAISATTGIVFGLVPSLAASRPSVAPGLKSGEDNALPGAGARRLGLRNALVAVQVAVSFVLLVGAGLLVRSLTNAENVTLGFDDERVAVVRADVSEAGYEGERRLALFREFGERVRGLGGVTDVTLTTRLPVSPTGGSSTLEIEDYEGVAGAGKAEVIFALVEPNYFSVLSIPLKYGRGFTTTDGATGDSIAIINEAFAKRYWGTEDAVGRRYRHEGSPDSWTRIVGVVGDSKVRTPDESPTPMVFWPLARRAASPRVFVIARAESDPSALVNVMRQELRAIDEDIPVYFAGTMDEHVSSSLAMPRAAAAVVALFGGLALLLAGLGLYAVVAFAVSKRTSEMGIRIALGASATRVISMVLKETALVVGIGLVLGVVLSLFATPALGSVLFDVAPSDPLTLAAMALFMVLVAMIAAYLPARRAAATNPVRALRLD